MLTSVSSLAFVNFLEVLHYPGSRQVIFPFFSDLSSSNFRLVKQDVCPRCQCDYQRRNTTLIFTVVILICIIIATFLIYILVVKLIWPKFFVPRTYKEQTDEINLEAITANNETNGEAIDANGDDDQGSGSQAEHKTKTSRFPVLAFLTKKQSKWQRELKEQQAHIYEDHTMLN